jgi:hypothetical protein
MGGREEQRRHEAERLPGLAPPDRDLRAGVLPVDLADLARAVRRALEGPGGEEPGRTRARWSLRIVIPPRHPAGRRHSRITVARTVKGLRDGH